jgi:hypothetical protein
MPHHKTKRSLMGRIPTLLLIAVAVLGAFALIAAVKAHARECASYGIRYVHREFPEYSYRERYCRRWVREEEYGPRVYGYERREREGDRVHCHAMQRVVGNQHLTPDGAKKAADEAWAGDVRFRFGELYMALENARHVVYTCSRSSIKEGGVTTLGQSLTRCELEATPCRAPRSDPLPPPQDRDER